MGVIVAPLVAITALSAPVRADEPQPSPSPTAAPSNPPTPSEQPSEQPTEQPSEQSSPSSSPTSYPTADPSADEQTPEGGAEASSSTAAPSPDATWSEDHDAVDAAASPASLSVPTVDVIASPGDIDEACWRLQLGSACGTSIDPSKVVTAAHALAKECVSGSSGLCATAKTAANDAVQLAAACVSALATVGGSAQASAVDVDCKQTAENALMLAMYVKQVADECSSGYTSTCQSVYDLAALALDRASGCLSGALGGTSAPRTVELSGADPGCADAVTFLWRTAEGAIAILTGCIADQVEMCNTAKGIADFGVATLTDCVGEAVLRFTDVPNPLPAKDADFQCWQAIDQVNHAINDVIGRLPGVPTEISVSDDCVITTRPRVIEDVNDPTDNAQELLVPSCYAPEVSPPVAPGAALLVAEGGLPRATMDGPTCNYTRDFKVNNELYNWKKRVDHVEETNINMKNVRVTLQLTKKDTFTATAGAATEAEVKLLVAKVKAQTHASISYSMEWDATSSRTVDIPAHYTYHYAYGVTSKIAEGNWVERLDDCTVKTGEFRRVKSPTSKGAYHWKEPYDGGPPE